MCSDALLHSEVMQPTTKSALLPVCRVNEILGVLGLWQVKVVDTFDFDLVAVEDNGDNSATSDGRE